MTTPRLTKSIGRSSSRLALLLIALLLVCIGLSPIARAVCQQGCDIPNANTFLGVDALENNTTGMQNTATGLQALVSNTTGNYNTANGVGALSNNTTGMQNTATGLQALVSNTTGSFNTANGVQALSGNTTGYFNTANGYGALVRNTTGGYNTATGGFALYNNITGAANIAMGLATLYSNSIGSNNTAVGVSALMSNTGSNNVGLGVNAGKDLTTGSGNVCIGGTVLGVAGESNTTRIRNIYSSVASGRAVYVDASNKIGTLASTRRVKENIKPMDKASEAVLALKPVSFRYKKEIDASGTLQFGLVAEEVADVNADLVTRDSEGKPETVRYDAVNAMLLNEFLKEHKAFLEEHSTVEELKKQVAALTAGLQEVSAQLRSEQSSTANGSEQTNHKNQGLNHETLQIVRCIHIHLVRAFARSTRGCSRS